MKTKKTMVTKVQYVCERCGREYLTQMGAIACEKRHGCGHADHEFDTMVGDWPVGVRGIVKICSNCSLEIDHVIFDDSIEDEHLEQIYNLLKENK